MKRLLITTACLALTGALLAGCGGSSKTSSSTGSGTPATSTPPTSTPATNTPATSQAAGGVVAVQMKDIAFKPAAATVKVGQTVKWVNADAVDHNVAATSGASFSSPTFGNGGSYEFKPTKPGTIKYVCTIHPNMTATLTVTR
jgi:plastocyanin